MKTVLIVSNVPGNAERVISLLPPDPYVLVARRDTVMLVVAEAHVTPDVAVVFHCMDDPDGMEHVYRCLNSVMPNGRFVVFTIHPELVKLPPDDLETLPGVECTQTREALEWVLSI